MVDYLLQHNKFAPNLSPDDVEAMRDKERGEFASLPDSERLRRLRIGFANKGRVPWNLGVPHRPETVAKISASVHKIMESSAIREKISRSSALKQSPEVRARISSGLRARFGTVNLQNRGQIKRCKRRPSTVTTGSVMFHCSGVGRSACATFVRPNWNLHKGYMHKTLKPKEKLPKKPPAPRKARSADVRARLAEAIRLKWQDEEFRQKVTERIRESCKTRLVPLRPPDPQPKPLKPVSAPKPKPVAQRPEGAALEVARVRDAPKKKARDEGAAQPRDAAAKPKRRRYTDATLIAVSRKQRMQLKDRLEKLARAGVLLRNAEAAVENLRAQERMLVGQPSASQRVRDAIQKAEIMLSSARDTVRSLEKLVEDAQVISDVEDLPIASAPPSTLPAWDNGNGRFASPSSVPTTSSCTHDGRAVGGDGGAAATPSGHGAGWSAESSNGAADGLIGLSYADYPRHDGNGAASGNGVGERSNGRGLNADARCGGRNGARPDGLNGSHTGMDAWDRHDVEGVSEREARVLHDVGEFSEPSMNGSGPRGQ